MGGIRRARVRDCGEGLSGEGGGASWGVSGAPDAEEALVISPAAELVG